MYIFLLELKYFLNIWVSKSFFNYIISPKEILFQRER